MNIAPGKSAVSTVPFDQARVDRLMEEAGIDVLLATSKHNTQYLLGGYKFIFFAAMDAIGHSRYLPIVVYEKGGPDHAAYIGNRMEGGEHQNHPFWTPTLHAACWGTLGCREPCGRTFAEDRQGGCAHRHRARLPAVGCLHADPQGAAGCQADRCDNDAGGMRAIKTDAELEKLRTASELITEFHAGHHRMGARRHDQGRDDRADQARGDQSRRAFRILPADAGRQPQPRRFTPGVEEGRGDVDRFRWQLSRLYRYLCRMGILGEPDAELEDLLAEVETVQQAAFSKVRAGTLGGDMISHAEGVLKKSRSRPIPISSPTAWA